MGHGRRSTGPRIVTYSAERRLRKPLQFLREYLSDLRSARHLAWEMARRDIVGQYRQTFLGPLLALLPGVVTTIWCTLIHHARIINVESLDMPYPAFVLISMTLWTTFVEALRAPIQALVTERAMLTRSNASLEAVVVGKLLVVLFNFGVKLLLVIGVVLYYRLPLAPTLLITPVGVLMLILLGSGIGLLLAPLNVLYRDISKAVDVITTFWLFLTPVLFPTPKEGVVGLIVRLNPVTPLLATTRAWAVLGVPWDPFAFCAIAVLTLVLLAFATVCSRVALPLVLERAIA